MFTAPMLVTNKGNDVEPFPEDGLIKVFEHCFVHKTMIYCEDDDGWMYLPTFQVTLMKNGLRFPATFRYKKRAIRFAEWINEYPYDASFERDEHEYWNAAYFGAMIEARNVKK